MPRSQVHLLLFAVMSLTWGLTWLATAKGVSVLPPFFFAATRFIAAGAIMLVLHAWRGGRLRLSASLWRRLVIAALLSITCTNGPMFFALTKVESGLAAVINLSLLPMFLLGIGVAYREERLSWWGIAGIALGIAGLVLLFNPAGPRFGDAGIALGALAILVGTICYAWGSVLNRPLLRVGAPLLVSGYASLLGGLALLPLSYLIEPAPDLAHFLDPLVLLGWFYLVIFGSVIAYTIFLTLLREWGPSRAGLFSFVSPVVAVVAGALLRGEQIGWLDIIAMAAMLGGAWLASRRPGSG